MIADGPRTFKVEAMRTAFHEQLDSLTELLSNMCGLAGLAMDRATQALLHADLTMAEQVFTDHDQLAHMQTSAEEAAFRTLALQSPVAGDLRADRPRAWLDVLATGVAAGVAAARAAVTLPAARPSSDAGPPSLP